MLRSILYITAFSLIIACQVSPREIEYGQDACAYCKMTVVDQRHAAQLVTEKGRNYVFDAIECMVNYQKEHSENYSFVLVADYLNPGQMVDANQAYYLVSQEIPSPMGAFLSGFKDLGELKALPEATNGEVYTWNDMPTIIR